MYDGLKSPTIEVSANDARAQTANFAGVDSRTILERVACCDDGAVVECVECYGNLIWGLAKKHTRSGAEAENAVIEIFKDIWKYAANFDAEKYDERSFIAHIALRRLLRI